MRHVRVKPLGGGSGSGVWEGALSFPVSPVISCFPAGVQAPAEEPSVPAETGDLFSLCEL